MGLLTRLVHGPGAAAPSAPRTVTATVYTGDETLEVVGESHYQDALWEIVGGHRSEHVRHPVRAVLIPDPTNAYDKNAIEVQIQGSLVGFLSREAAVRYLPGLLRLMEDCGFVALDGVIVGGGERADGPGSLGVFLDHDPADFGLSYAGDPDGDDDYDFSWQANLSADDATAINQLRTLLEDERDLLDRHYMFNELEARLYKTRSASPSALKEFDAACLQHDQEMRVIRPALIKEFGTLPIIPMYRQASIRWQKAKGWQAAREWAERGIAFYGTDARPDIVEDLRKRSANAQAKMEEALRQIKPDHTAPEQ